MHPADLILAWIKLMITISSKGISMKDYAYSSEWLTENQMILKLYTSTLRTTLMN